MKFKLIVIIMLISLLTGCAIMPKTFIKAIEPGWNSVELREGLTYEEAWQSVVDVLAKKFEIAIMSKDGGYIRTSWIYTWWKEGELTSNYKVRVIIKFSPDKKKIDLKTEAQYKNRSGEWIMGYDTRLLSTIKSDIMGIIGRTTH